MPRSTLLLLGKDGDEALGRLYGWLNPHCNVNPWWDRLDYSVEYDAIVSYRYHYKVPAAFLVPHAINFHPAPPWHRGVGGPDWAIKDKWTTFGVTAHYMTAEIDAGPIIAWRSFAIWPKETVESLNQRAHAHLLALASDVLCGVAQGRWPEPDLLVKWEGPLHTRKQLDALCAS